MNASDKYDIYHSLGKPKSFSGYDIRGHRCTYLRTILYGVIGDTNRGGLQVLSLIRSDGGHFHLAADGVMRSYDSHQKVIDYVRLSNEQISAEIASLPPSVSNQTKSLNESFRDVSGLNVTDKDQLFNPPSWLRSPATRSPHSPNPSIEVKRTVQYGPANCLAFGWVCETNDECQAMGCIACLFWFYGTHPIGICIIKWATVPPK